MIEIYNNNIYDLFEDHIEQTQNNKPPQAKNLRENSTRGIFIPGLAYVPVNSVSEALTFYRKGKKRRKIAETLLNSTSSRSHCVFTLYLVQIERGNDNVHVRLLSVGVSVGCCEPTILVRFGWI
uniref:Kinesin-like protein KIF23 (Trinotate prediction) n=1 Tax=Henneguya salminicola TaxID=69463 RepID=A0A6G3MKB8_HENSL